MDREIVLPKFDDLAFEPETHIYRLDGIEIPSVTTVMKPLTSEKYQGIREDTLNAAAEKGTSVHNAIENWIKFGIVDIQPEHQGYFDAFIDWWNEKKPVVVGSEIRAYHRIMRYAGTLDLLCFINNELTLVDYKTTCSVDDKTFGIQTEAYAQMLRSFDIQVDRKMILHIKKNGVGNEIDYPVNDSERWRVFGALKCVYDYSKK